MRFDSDTVTSSVHAAPRVGFQLALTRSGRTMLRGGIGEFYDRVPLMIPAFQWLPERTVFILDPAGQVTSTTAYPQPDYRRSSQPAEHGLEFGTE